MKSRYRETPGFLEQLASQVAGRLIVFCARRSNARGDLHEFNHSLAAVLAGNTEECTARCAFLDLTADQVKALLKALAAGRLSTPTGEPLR
jgi:hypothetical protein